MLPQYVFHEGSLSEEKGAEKVTLRSREGWYSVHDGYSYILHIRAHHERVEMIDT